MEAGDVVVELRGVTKRYTAADGTESGPEILRDVDLEIRAGESVAIVGPSGSGKSTLLNIIGALSPVTSGSASVAGVELSKQSEEELARFRNETVGFVFQSHHLLPQCSALENVLVPTLVDPDAQRRGQAPDRASELLGEVGLSERSHHRPAQMSGGENQRVAVVRALINQPRVLLADEPTGSLDSEAAEALADLLVRINERDGVTLIVVTHSQALAQRMQRTLVLRGGQLEQAVTA